ncbi:hypothetical protein [Alloprevotella tannerae]
MPDVTLTQTQNSGAASTPVDVTPTTGAGSAGLNTQIGGAPTTVSGIANATGGMGNFVMPEIDKNLLLFERNKNAIMQLMLMAKRVDVKSMEIKHYAIDQGTPIVTVASVNGDTITLVNADKGKVRAYDTLMVKGVKGYDFVKGSGSKMNRRPLQLFVKSVNNDDTITCVATNGVKQAETDQYGSLPTATSPTASNKNIIVAGTKLVRMGNALYETQKWVDPNTVIPVPDDLYLQKRGMTSIVSKYLSDQRTEIPYDEAVRAEAQLREFKAAGNRSLLISQQCKMLVRSSMGDDQWDYITNGARWQVKRELKHRGEWTFEEIMALIKLYYGGADKPSSGILLSGENLGMSFQLIDWSKHPEVRVEPFVNETFGWKVTKFSCIFGEIQIKLEDTLDDCGLSNCGLLLDPDRLVHYVRKGEANYTEDVQGEEAVRNGILVSDALGLKGNCHIWIDGGDDEETAPGADEFRLWGSKTAPAAKDLEDGIIYVFANDTTLTIETTPKTTIDVEAGDAYKYSASANSNKGGWTKFYGPISTE